MRLLSAVCRHVTALVAVLPLLPDDFFGILTATFGYGDLQAVGYAAMKAVMDIETELGFMPRDVSAEKVGYDVESDIPKALRKNGLCLRFIEVKGRAKGATSITVSKNEILTDLNKPDEYILAIVEADDGFSSTP